MTRRQRLSELDTSTATSQSKRSYAPRGRTYSDVQMGKLRLGGTLPLPGSWGSNLGFFQVLSQESGKG